MAVVYCSMASCHFLFLNASLPASLAELIARACLRDFLAAEQSGSMRSTCMQSLLKHIKATITYNTRLQSIFTTELSTGKHDLALHIMCIEIGSKRGAALIRQVPKCVIGHARQVFSLSTIGRPYIAKENSLISAGFGWKQTSGSPPAETPFRPSADCQRCRRFGPLQSRPLLMWSCPQKSSFGFRIVLLSVAPEEPGLLLGGTEPARRLGSFPAAPSRRATALVWHRWTRVTCFLHSSAHHRSNPHYRDRQIVDRPGAPDYGCDSF